MAGFKIGQHVTWASQANGSTLKKTGKIIEVVPAQQMPNNRNGFGLLGRNHESYVVEVTLIGPRGPRKPRWYWPIVSKLELAKTPKGS